MRSRSKLGQSFARWLAASFVASALLPSMANAQVEPSAGMMRSPDVSETHIVFSYADDLWIVDRDGGTAVGLANPAGVEREPRFSPDGTSIAFVANYDGGSDIYTMPVKGGVAKRMTYNPGSEALCDWNPATGELIYSTNAYSGLGRVTKLMKVSGDHPVPEALPVPYGSNGSISADGKWLAYTPHSRDSRTWKRYQGGMASDVWLFNLENKTAKRITDFAGTDSFPMWNGDKVYYLSDGGKEHRLNIWVYDTKTEERSQITKFTDFDCKSPSMGPGVDGKGEIVFQNGKSLYLLNLESGESKTVSIQIPGARPSLHTQLVDASESISGGSISPNAKRVAVEAAGDIWTLPVKNGSPRNLTNSSNAHERDPDWSPDGRWIAYLSDVTGEYELYLCQSDGKGEIRQLTREGSAFRYRPTWSPDSKHLIFTDKTGSAFICSVDDSTVKKFAQDPQGSQINAQWSHNSQWVTYALSPKEFAGNSSVWVYQVSDGTARKLTSGFFNDSNPVFDRKGEYVFFSSNRAFNRPEYEDIGTTFIYAGTEVLMALPLREDIKNPMLPKIDEETWKEESKQEEDSSEDTQEKAEESKESDKGSAEKSEETDGQPQDSKKDEASDAADKSDSDDKDKSKAEASDDSKADKKSSEKKDEDKAAKDFAIEFENAEARSFQVPVQQGNFGGIAVNDKNQLIYSRRSGRGGGGESGTFLYDLFSDKRKETEVAGSPGFGISADGKKLLFGRRSNLYVVDSKPGQKLEDPVVTKGMMVQVNPKEQWRQIFSEAWRLERDFFYDPNMHGVDWEGVRDHYGSMLEDCVSRRDLSFLIREMIAELNVGHAYYREAPLENGESANTGVFGCEFSVDGEALKIAHIYQGADWDYDAKNPLVQAGVKEGQYLLEVNGEKVDNKTNPFSLLVGLRGATVTLTVSDDATLDDKDSKIPFVVPGGDSDLRFRDWIEANRKYVEEKSDGKIGYIYVVNTGVPGQNDLFRQFYGQAKKEALIIDDRWNGGGQIPTRFIELLNRPVTNYWARRDAVDWTWPPDSHQGPKCMLINGMAGSGGDMFPALFKQNELGPLVGMRTWGGLVGISGSPSLVDGASITAPSFAYYEKDGTWGIEGHGVDPDVEVIDDPEKMADGKDPQLDVAIEMMLKEIKENGYKAPNRPTYPDRKGMGIKSEDK